MCRELKGKQALAKVLKKGHEATLDMYNKIGDEDDFRELLDPPDIVGEYKIYHSFLFPYIKIISECVNNNDCINI